MADAEGWIAIIDAYVESRRRNAVEERDPLATTLTPEQRRADALLAMIRAHQAGRRAPSTGGDRPRVVVEPARHGVRDQWELRIAGDGLPEAIPPRRYDASRRPLRHARLGPPGPGESRPGTAPPGPGHERLATTSSASPRTPSS